MSLQQIYNFLVSLHQNNNREWFQANKKEFDTVKKSFEEFTLSLIEGIQQFDEMIEGVTPKECIFRIYRDVRFSKDKSPYKNHFGAYIAPGGRKSITAGYYIHFEPGGAFAGGGIYRPQKEVLQAIRNEIYYHPKEFIAILNEPGFEKYFGGLSEMDEKLKKPPKGFPADFELIDLLKHKSFVNGHNISDAQLQKEDLTEYLMKVFQSMYDFNAFLYRAVANIE